MSAAAFIRTIHATRDDHTKMLAFVITFDVNGSPAPLTVTEDVILDYFSLQRFILATTGHVWKDDHSEGRPIEAARENWKANLAFIVQAPPWPTQAPPVSPN